MADEKSFLLCDEEEENDDCLCEECELKPAFYECSFCESFICVDCSVQEVLKFYCKHCFLNS